MSIRQGNKIISGGDRLPGWGTPLLSCMWADHKLNSVSWLRADTFSWQSGNVYISAYNHLVEDLHDSATTIHTEVISGNTITYYLTPDKHRICLGDQAQTVDAIYQATGISWYFILDEGKKRFKLPRTKWGFTGLRNDVGENVEAGLPNITAWFNAYSYGDGGGSGAVTSKISASNTLASGSQSSYNFNNFLIDASDSNAIYGNSNTVQPPATEMYLYFYVGNFDVNKDILDTAKLSELVNEFNITEFEAEVQESKNKAISEISTIYPDVVRYTSSSPNTITKIPQDIKLELNDGVLTLKAGSKVYVPNGPGKFDERVIESDSTLAAWNGEALLCVCVNKSGNLQARLYSKSISGDDVIAPGGFGYDTKKNQITFYSSEGAVGSTDYSFPVAIVRSTNSGKISYIDKIFNGFGYIGQSYFILPGVTCISPDGRNEDGTLRNIEFTIDSVKTGQRTWNSEVSQIIAISKNHVNILNKYVVSDVQPTNNAYTLWYQPSSNLMYRNSGETVENMEVESGWVYIGNIGNGKNITTWDVNNVVNILDTNDYNSLEDKIYSGVSERNISNCITEINNNVKISLVDNNLYLEPGTTVYVPNGSNVFDKYIIDSRIIWKDTTKTGQWLVGWSVTGSLCVGRLSSSVSGDVAPTTGFSFWYDTTNNIIKRYGSSLTEPNFSDCCLPLAIITLGSDGVVSIDQVFNGFGYIGSTAFALPGVKGLMPAGRNSDGSLKNTEIECSYPQILNISGNSPIYIALDYRGGLGWWNPSAYEYKENENYNYYQGVIRNRGILGIFYCSNGVITDFQPDGVFHAVGYNDADFISHQPMPSNTYEDLTLGSTGTTYTARANGWFILGKKSSAVGEFINIDNGGNTRPSVYVWSTLANKEHKVYVPVKNGDQIYVSYSMTGETTFFRFVYSVGSK